MFGNGGNNVGPNSISAMLRKNSQAPGFNAYINQCQPVVERNYVSKMAKVAFHPTIPLPPPPPEGNQPLISITEKEDKNKYVIGETKEEIIQNIIDKKASASNVRKALSKYADIIMEQDLF